MKLININNYYVNPAYIISIEPIDINLRESHNAGFYINIEHMEPIAYTFSHYNGGAEKAFENAQAARNKIIDELNNLNTEIPNVFNFSHPFTTGPQ